MRKPIGVAALLLATAAVQPSWAETRLRFTETATMQVKPDEQVASLRVEGIAATAAEAQQSLNSRVKEALPLVQDAHDVHYFTRDYFVSLQPPQTPQERPTRWRASQRLDLRAADSAADFLPLVEKLQQNGLALERLGAEVTEPLLGATRDKVTREALTRIRGHAEAMARSFGMQFDSFGTITVQSDRSAVMRPMMAASRASAPPPTNEPQDVTVTVTVEVEAILKPGPN